MFIHVVYKERQSLGCHKIVKGPEWTGKTGKAVVGSEPSETATASELLDTMTTATTYQDRFVKWRIFIIVAILSAVMMWFVMYRKLVPEWELVVISTIIFAVSSAAVGFYKFHLDDHVMNNMRKSIEMLKQKI